MPGRRPKTRVLVAVEPNLLADALAGAIAEIGDDVVVLPPDESAAATGEFDAAVVTIVLPDDVHADVVIELPDHEGGRGTATVRRGNDQREVRIDGLDDLLDLLR